MANRCIPGRLYLLGESSGADSCDFSYVSLHDMSDMLSPQYFLACRDRLKHADVIRLVQRADGGRVVSVCLAMVVQVSREFVELLPFIGPTEVAKGTLVQSAAAALSPSDEYRVKRGYQCFLVVNSAGKELNEFNTKAEAEAAALELNVRHAQKAAA